MFYRLCKINQVYLASQVVFLSRTFSKGLISPIPSVFPLIFLLFTRCYHLFIRSHLLYLYGVIRFIYTVFLLYLHKLIRFFYRILIRVLHTLIRFPGCSYSHFTRLSVIILLVFYRILSALFTRSRLFFPLFLYKIISFITRTYPRFYAILYALFTRYYLDFPYLFHFFTLYSLLYSQLSDLFPDLSHFLHDVFRFFI